MTKRISYTVGNDSRLIFMETAVEALTGFRQLTPESCEAGGLLLGRHLLQGGYIVIDQITTPMPFDKRTRLGFYRSLWHNVKAKRIWKESKQTQSLLGVWHSHPERIPTPSRIDLLDWQHVLVRGKFVGDRLFFVIVGISAIAVWQGVITKTVSFHELIPDG